jgi:hypothetical protein
VNVEFQLYKMKISGAVFHNSVNTLNTTILKRLDGTLHILGFRNLGHRITGFQ